jgi:hypothetical protein
LRTNVFAATIACWRPSTVNRCTAKSLLDAERKPLPRAGSIRRAPESIRVDSAPGSR